VHILPTQAAAAQHSAPANPHRITRTEWLAMAAFAALSLLASALAPMGWAKAVL
jgi:hypothetical protein